MKKISLLLLCFLSIQAANATRPSVLFSTAVFDNPGGKPFVELYMQVDGSTVTSLKSADGKYHGAIQVEVVLKKDQKPVYTDKYNLNCPATAEKETPDITDMQRIEADRGSYQLSVKVYDKNAATPEAAVFLSDLAIDLPTDRITVSGIELLESFTKSSAPTRFTRNGMELMPLASAFYPPAAGTLKFYAEVYRADELIGADSLFLIRYRIEGRESKKTAANLGGTQKAKAKQVNVVLSEIPLDELQSGNYSLVVEAVSRANVVLATRTVDFQRVSRQLIPLAKETVDSASLSIEGSFVENLNDIDSLKEYIRCLRPIADRNEQLSGESHVKLADRKSMKMYLLYFWSKRNKATPEADWKEYMVRVGEVNYSFKTFNRKGYDSDRGRVYLQYGRPNERVTSYNEPRSFPYEIWQYNRLGNQTNRKFVFLSKNMAANDFELIHSDAIGEINQPRWQLMLEEKENAYGTDWNTKESDDYYGKKSKDYFDRPK